MIEVQRTFAVPERVGVEMVGIPAGGDVAMDLRLESVSEGVLVSGTVCAATEGQCGRCLEPMASSVNLYLTELFAYPDSATEQTSDEEDIARLVDDLVDLEQVIIDAVGTELPLTPVCDADCSGLCVECGVRLADAEPNHGHDIIDPRWAALMDRATEPGDSTETHE